MPLSARLNTIVPVAFITLVALTGCGKKEASAPASAQTSGKEVVVRIGHVSPMTGPQAHQGEDCRDGALLAVEDLNASKPQIGGMAVRFQLIAEDDQADPKQGTVVAQKLVDEKVSGVVGHMNSGTTIPASKIYFDAGIPQISGSATNPTYTRQGFSTAFRVMSNDVQQGSVLAEFAHKQGFRTVALIDDRTAYGQGLADEFRKAADALGLRIVATEFTTDKATDFKAILTRIKSKKPELVFFGGMDAQGGPLAKQMKELGLKAGFLGGDGVCSPEFAKLAGDASEGLYCSRPGMPLEKLSQGPAFLEKFSRRFGKGIQIYSPYVYDAVMVMADAMKRADSIEPAKYLPLIQQTQYEGVTSKIAFDAKGDLKNSAISFYRYKGGAMEYVETLGQAGTK